MKPIIFAFLLVSLCFAGCAPSQMSISDQELPKINPIALYIIGSTQILDNGDSLHRDFTINTAAQSISKLFEQKGYSVKQLNPSLPIERVFNKSFGVFHIDEDTVAAVARMKGCESFLIVYYAYEGSDELIDNGLHVYRACSLYGWFGYASNADVFSSSHTALNSYYKYRDYARTKNPNASESTVYRHFLSDIAKFMFGNISDNPIH